MNEIEKGLSYRLVGAEVLFCVRELSENEVISAVGNNKRKNVNKLIQN